MIFYIVLNYDPMKVVKEGEIHEYVIICLFPNIHKKTLRRVFKMRLKLGFLKYDPSNCYQCKGDYIYHNFISSCHLVDFSIDDFNREKSCRSAPHFNFMKVQVITRDVPMISFLKVISS